jgi:hypothetical protein
MNNEPWGLFYIVPVFKGRAQKEAKNYRGFTLNNIKIKNLLANTLE